MDPITIGMLGAAIGYSHVMEEGLQAQLDF